MTTLDKSTKNNGKSSKEPVLVVIQLSGGNDFMNTVIPFNGSKDSEWSIFLEDCDGLVRSIIHGIATQPFF